VNRARIAFQAVDAGGLVGKSPTDAVRSLRALVRGCWQAYRVLGRFRPDVVLATGGYASAPAVVAAWLRRCPVLIYLPDVSPGLAVRVLSHLARRVAVTFDATQDRFPPNKAVVTGYPVRGALFVPTGPDTRRRLGLETELPLLLILGGSSGARSINQATLRDLDALLALAEIIHIVGEHDLHAALQSRGDLPEALRCRYHPHAYLHEEMLDALRAADLAVARAGAATMGEFSAVGLPSVLVPYPYAGFHQAHNADYMVSRGAAVRIDEASLSGGALSQAVLRLLQDPQQRAIMSERARSLARPDAARHIALELGSLAGDAR